MRNENYQNVLKFNQTEVTIFDSGAEDNDVVDVSFNGVPIQQDLVLTNEGVTLPLTLGTGPNELTITAKNLGTATSSNSVGARFPDNLVLIGESDFGKNLQQGESISRTIGLPRIRINGDRAPFTAQNVRDKLSEPTVLTVGRAEANSRRRVNTSAYRREQGIVPRIFEIDEAPNATLVPLEGLPNGPLAYYQTRPIPQRDNSSSGGSFGRQIDNYGGKTLESVYNVDFYASEPNYKSGISKRNGIYGTDGDDDGQANPALEGTPGVNDVIYGFDGNDRLVGSVGRGENTRGNSRDVLLGGSGNDRLFGKGDNDILYGQADSDFLRGGRGNDILNGGPGSDILLGEDNIIDDFFGRNGRNRYILGPNKGTDFLLDFNPDNDIVELLDGATPDNIVLEEAGRLRFSELGLTPQDEIAFIIPSH